MLQLQYMPVSGSVHFPAATHRLKAATVTSVASISKAAIVTSVTGFSSGSPSVDPSENVPPGIATVAPSATATGVGGVTAGFVDGTAGGSLLTIARMAKSAPAPTRTMAARARARGASGARADREGREGRPSDEAGPRFESAPSGALSPVGPLILARGHPWHPSRPREKGFCTRPTPSPRPR